MHEQAVEKKNTKSKPLDHSERKKRLTQSSEKWATNYDQHNKKYNKKC
jgi:hypothetical protein